MVEAAILEKPDQRKIPGINKLNNFEFRDDIIVTRRVYGIGEGSQITANEGLRGTSCCFSFRTSKRNVQSLKITSVMRN